MDASTSPSRRYSRLLPKPMPEPNSPPPTAAPQKRPVAFTKREVIRVACGRCAKRKSKCDGLRPQCSGCARSGVTCVYDVEREQGRTNFLRRQNQMLAEENNILHCLFDTLRSCPQAEAYEILRRLNASDNLEETAKLVRDSSLLLQTTRCYQTSSPPESTISSDLAVSPMSKSSSVTSGLTFPGGADILGPTVSHQRGL